MEIVPLRLGIKYNPATLALFFQDPVGKRRVRRFRIDLSRAKSPMDLAIIAKGLADNNQQYFAGVKTEQLAKLVNRINFARSTGEAGTAGVSDGKDLNSVTAQELTQAKAKMSVGFEANKVTPGDAAFEYDKQVDFEPEEDNDWDDDFDDDVDNFDES